MSQFGHGSFWDGEECVLAHRWAYESARGLIPDGSCVIHKCDIPACVSLDHLMLGTRAENNFDKIAKGRERPARGESTSKAKLTDDAVRAMRAEYGAGGVTQKQLAEKYSTLQTNVSQVVRRQTWKHIQ